MLFKIALSAKNDNNLRGFLKVESKLVSLSGGEWVNGNRG